MTIKELKDIVSINHCLLQNEDHEIFIDPHDFNNYTVTETGIDTVWEFSSFDDMLDGFFVNGEPLRGALSGMDWA